ncbi:hypothetical protein GCM10009854_16650 [Saccharopolyspora halophila]|uniref:Outer membrane channel protein CpnT-like N-terminal domain-containing protein n=1 Tax=Saccharopolyspora halophila TaxID=405551 RepID=A0ABN3FZ88_9PSEU
MSIEIPGEVSWLFPIVVGANWPEGDEDALRRVAEAWNQCGVDVGEVLSETEGAVQAALGTMEGQTHDAFEQFMKDFTDGEGHLPALQKLCEALGEGADKAALEVEYTKLSIIAALVILAAQIAAMIASAAATFGASTSGIPIAQAATQLTVRTFFQQLLTKIAEGVLVNTFLNVGVDLAIQGTQALAGDREEWDAGKTGTAAANGAISGVASGVAGGVVDGAAGKLGQTLGKDLLGNATSNFTEAAAYGAARGALTGSLGTVLNKTAHGDFDYSDPTAVTPGAISGGIGGATSGMQSRHEGLDTTWEHNGRGPTSSGDGEWVSGSNTQGWRFQTEEGAVAGANVDSPYTSGVNSSNVGTEAEIKGGPNSVISDSYGDVDDEQQRSPDRLDLPEAER